MDKLRKIARESFKGTKCKESSLNLDQSKSVNVGYNHPDLVSDFKEEKFTFIWRVENIHRCALKCQEFFESPMFSTRFCGEVKWALRLYPRGRKISNNIRLNKTCAEIGMSHFEGLRDKDCEKVGIFIRKISTDSVNSSFRYRLTCKRCFLNSASKETCIYKYPEHGEDEIKLDSSECGADDLYCPEDFSEPETLIVTCTIYVTNIFNMGAPSDLSTDLTGTLFQDLKGMYESGKFADVTLQANDVKFPAHKAILASRSKVFDAMFQHDMKESQTNVVQIKDIEPAVLSILLQYMYTGTVDDFNVEKAIDLYPVADKYLLKELKKMCGSTMLANMTVNNVCRIAVLADLHADLRLKEAAFNMFRNYTSEIFKRKEWDDLIEDANHHALVSEIQRAVSAVFITNCKDN